MARGSEVEVYRVALWSGGSSGGSASGTKPRVSERLAFRKKRVVVVDAFVDQRAAMRVSVAPRAGL